ncbi:hypothetical protein AVEN_125112-1 [Araneus ventricosus]|uniref:Reverse transcriptase/retrotransposon-derived protein RNase H-like domain-containing protein n=1 Tax=Araneus ventricosus TaxID=182803 RepID=A0A4Y2FR06_ARAVE|nr:hypothetical protein AVEN_125112-1 [Araneus ventricosus]
MGVNQLEFLGYMITPESSKPLPEKVNVILNYRLPETIHELRTFLGLINFYRRYIKDAVKNRAVLHEYLKGTKKKYKSKIPWTKEAKEKFTQCKIDLANATLLSFPNPDSLLALFSDASDYAVGSVLQQFEEDSWNALAFFPRRLTNAQKGYSTYGRELKRMRNPHQDNYIVYNIYQFSTDIRHIGGKENIVADSLPRIESIYEIDFDKIADAQIDNKDLNELRSKPSLHFKQYPLDSVVKRHDKYFTITIKGKDIIISVDRLKPAYLLLTEVDAPHHKKLYTSPTLPNENLTSHQKTEKQQSDLLDIDVQKRTTRSDRRVRFPARYKD